MIEIIRGDLTEQNVDVIVNAANRALMGGGGIDGAIHRAGGPIILEECRKIIADIKECLPGNAVITSAGEMPAKYVIHTVGPVWRGGKENETVILSNCYKNSLALAVTNNCKTIAFPAISTGVFHFPKKKAAKIAVDTIMGFTSTNKQLSKVLIVCYDIENFEIISNYYNRKYLKKSRSIFSILQNLFFKK